MTSRRALTGLDGARSLQLDVLSPDEAVTLLGRLAGDERIAAERAAAGQVARWCGYLPLALRIAGARLAARPAWPVAALVERLADAQRRLNELELADLGVRASLAVSRQELRDSAEPVDQLAAAALAALAIADGPDLGVPAAARLLDRPPALAERVLERLVDANLLETAAPGRYRLHDLLRLYGRELADATSSGADRAAALTRAFGFYTATCWHTLDLLRPGDYRRGRADARFTDDHLDLPDATAALDWLETERANLVAAVAQTATAQTTAGPPAELAVQLAQAMFGLFRVRGYWADAVRVYEHALTVATAAADRPALAALRIDLGAALGQQEHIPEARECLTEAIALHRELGDRQGEAAALINLGVIHQVTAHYDDALACYQASLAISEDLDNLRGQAMSLSNLATINRRKHRHDEALSLHQRSLAIYAKLGDRYAQAVGLVNLGVLYEAMHRYPDAEACLRESRTIYHEMGDRYGESETITDLGILYRKQGRYELALQLQRQALTNCRQLGRREGQAVNLLEQGITLQALGRHTEARACWQESLTLFEQLSSNRAQDVRALLTG